MKILFVLECSGFLANGTTTSCRRFAEELNKRGHEVKIVGCSIRDDFEYPYYYTVRDFNMWPFNGLIRKDGFQFTHVDNKLLYELIKSVDVVHLFLPFKLESNARLIADQLGVPVTCAFHLQPNSITSALHLCNDFFNWILYKSFHKYLYNWVSYVHCPSEMIKNKLKSLNYDNELRVMSNGISEYWHKVPSNRQYGDKFVVTMVGRLSKEKRQDLLIKAVRHSKYEKNIQLVLCGDGPNKRKLKKLIKKLNFTNEPIIQFLSQEKLREFLSSIDLYAHCSDAEIEGLSCVEAFACGVVPVISNSKLSATHTFSLCPESLFRHGKYKDLMKKIEYWYENKEKRAEYSIKYEESAKEYALGKQVTLFEEFLGDAINLNKEKKDKQSLNNRKKDKKRRKKIFKKLYKQGVIEEMPKI